MPLVKRAFDAASQLHSTDLQGTIVVPSSWEEMRLQSFSYIGAPPLNLYTTFLLILGSS